MRIAIAALILGLGFMTGRAADAGAKPSGARVALELEDGCIIVGQLGSETLTFESQILGKMQIPVERIAKVEASAAHASVLMRNGDTLQAGLADQELQMETIFGKLKIPRKQVIVLRCNMAEAGQAEKR